MTSIIEETDTEIEEWKAFVYLFLARLYRQAPDEEILMAINDDRLLDDLFTQNSGALYKLTNALTCEVEARQSDYATYRSELNADYNKLFVGPGPLVAPPWESVYCSKERLVFGEQTLAVREVYRSFGLNSKEQGREPDDHIALELEFMAWLCKNSNISAQHQFLTSHLLKWGQPFCTDVVNGADTAFYRIVAQLTIAWLDQINGSTF